MFAKTTNVGFAQRVVATLVASAVVMASYGAYNIAQAANLTNISDTLSDSDLSVTSAHTVEFTIPAASALGTGDLVTIAFPVEFTGVNTVVGGDVTLTVNGGAATFSNFQANANSIEFNSDTAAAATEEVIVAIADGKITNPSSAGSYEISVDTGAAGDSGKTRVAIIDNVEVTAIVETTFDFVISGVSATTTINGEATTGSTTATAIPFGVLAADTPYILGQQLNVTTNARNGFVVTVETDGDLQSSTGAVIDTFSNGTDVTTPTAWASPADDISLENTWGHWGLSSDDDLSTTGGTDFASGEYIAASTTPRQVFTHDGPSDGTTADIGEANVLYQLEITPLQEAGDDYNTTLTYIATPTF